LTAVVVDDLAGTCWGANIASRCVPLVSCQFDERFFVFLTTRIALFDSSRYFVDFVYLLTAVVVDDLAGTCWGANIASLCVPLVSCQFDERFFVFLTTRIASFNSSCYFVDFIYLLTAVVVDDLAGTCWGANIASLCVPLVSCQFDERFFVFLTTRIARPSCAIDNGVLIDLGIPIVIN
jgi:hypothetical protein